MLDVLVIYLLILFFSFFSSVASLEVAELYRNGFLDNKLNVSKRPCEKSREFVWIG